MPLVRVLKFGGSSLRDAKRMRHVAGIVESYVRKNIQPILVLSAMDKTTANLIQCATKAAQGDEIDMDPIAQLHTTTLQELGLEDDVVASVMELLDHCSNILKGVTLVGELSPATQDVIMSFGERMSVRIFAGLLRRLNIPAKAWDAYDIGLQVQGVTHGSTERERIGAELVDGSYDVVTSVLLPEIQSNIVPVITGFIGTSETHVVTPMRSAKNEEKRITTLGRGGSDLSASFIGSAMLAEAVEIWTDTDGILTGDPRMVANPRSIAQLTFEQAGELAHYGAKVLHPRTIEPAMHVGVPVVVRNSYNPDHPGTTISSKIPEAEPAHFLVALTLKSPVILVDIKATHMLGQYGFLAEVFAVFQRFRISVDVIATSEVSISITLDKDTELRNVEGLKRALKGVADVTILVNSSTHPTVAWRCTLYIGVVVGGTKYCCTDRKQVALMRHLRACLWDIKALQYGELLRVAQNVGDPVSDIQIEMVSLGASKLNTSLVIAKEEGPIAVRALHDVFFPLL